MIRLLWTLSVYADYYLHRYAPTNRLLDAIRTRRGLKWGLPARLLAVPLLFAASICTTLVDSGRPGWLYLVVIWAIWNALKFIVIGPVSLVLLIRSRLRETLAKNEPPH